MSPDTIVPISVSSIPTLERDVSPVLVTVKIYSTSVPSDTLSSVGVLVRLILGSRTVTVAVAISSKSSNIPFNA